MHELLLRPAASDLRDRVLGYRGFRFDVIGTRRRLLIPDAVVKVMVGFGDPVRVRDSADPTLCFSGVCLASGARTTSAIGEHTGLIHGVTILLTPLAAYRLFGVPMSEWAQLSVPPEDLRPSPWADLPARLAHVSDWGRRFALLDHVLRQALDTGPAVSPEVAWAWHRIRTTGGRIRVEELAARTGWSRRHLERRFRAQIGLTPKGTAQVMRLQAALSGKEAGATWADAAAQAGYHDQPHFDRVFKAMTGRTPSAFSAYRSGASLHDAQDFVPGQVTSAMLRHPN